MIYCFDLDNTICATPSSKNYEESVPYRSVINKINRFKTRGFYIKIFTARGSGSGIDWSQGLTDNCLEVETWIAAHMRNVRNMILATTLLPPQVPHEILRRTSLQPSLRHYACN